MNITNRKFSLLFLSLIFFILPFHAKADGNDPGCDNVQEMLPSQRSNYGRVLIAAAARGDLPEIRRLLSLGASPNYSDVEIMTPLAWAARCGHVNAVRVLVDGGADVNFRVSYQMNWRYRTKNSSALIWAVRNEHSDVVRFLVEKGADVSRREKGYELIGSDAQHVREKFYGMGMRAGEMTKNREILALLKKRPQPVQKIRHP